MKKLRLFISASLSVLCVLLLANERKELVFVPMKPVRMAIYDEKLFRNFSVAHFDPEQGVRSLLDGLQTVHQQEINQIYENLACLPLADIEMFRNQSEVKINEIGDDLIDWLNRTVYAHLTKSPSAHFVNSLNLVNSASSPNLSSNLGSKSNSSSSLSSQLSSKQKLAMTTRLLNKQRAFQLKVFELSILESIRSKRFYFIQNKFCLVYDLPLAFRMLADMFYNLRHYVLLKSSLRWFQLRAGEFDLTLISHEENPNLSCSANQSIKFGCLNECFKRKHSLSDYFYAGDEAVTVQLTHQLNRSTQSHNFKENTRKTEEICFSECAKSDCIQANLKRKNFDNSIEITVVKARSIISQFNYCIILVGLILALFKTSCYKMAVQLAEFMSNKLYKKLKQEDQSEESPKSLSLDKENRPLPFRVGAFLFCLLAFLILANKIRSDYQERQNDQNPRLAVTYLSKPEAISLIICVPVDEILRTPGHFTDFNSTDSDSSDSDSTPSSNQTNQTIDPSNLNLASLEILTRGTLNQTLNDVYLEFLGRRYAVFWRWLSKRVFFVNVNRKLARCDRVFVKAEDPKFRSFLSASKLVISFKHSLFALYLLPGNQQFHSKSYRYQSTNKFVKAIHRNEHCIHYLDRFRTCDSMVNCRDQCVTTLASKRDETFRPTL